MSEIMFEKFDEATGSLVYALVDSQGIHEVQDRTARRTIDNIVAQKMIDNIDNITSDYYYPSVNAVKNYVTNYAQSLPFTIIVTINSNSTEYTINKTCAEIESAFNAQKQVRLKCTWAQYELYFEEDICRFITHNNNTTLISYISHIIIDNTHFIISIYEDPEDNTTKVLYQRIVDNYVNNRELNNTLGQLMIQLNSAFMAKQDSITSNAKLSADLVNDTNTTNKFVTATDKTTWSGKQDNLVSGTNIKTINGNNILGSGDLIIHPEIVNLTDGDSEHNSGYYEDLMRTVDVLKLNTSQIFIYTAYNNNHIATTAMCFSVCTNTESTTTNAVIKQTLFLGTYKSIRTLSNTISDNKYQVVDNWTEILDVKQSDLNTKISKSGDSMTGNINMNGYELQVSGNRNGIKFSGNNQIGILVGNGNMSMTLETGVGGLFRHKIGNNYYNIIDDSIKSTSISSSSTNNQWVTPLSVYNYAQPKIDSSNKISADLIDDTSSTNKFTTITFRTF